MLNKKYQISIISILGGMLSAGFFFLIFGVQLLSGKIFYPCLWMGLAIVIYVIFYAKNSYVQLTDDGISINVGAFFVDNKFVPYEKINNFELVGNFLKDLKIYTGIDQPIMFKSVDQGKELVEGIAHMINSRKNF